MGALVILLENAGMRAYFAWPAVREILVRLVLKPNLITTFLVSALGTLAAGWDELKEGLAAYILQTAGIDIAPDDLHSREAWQIALGKRLADLANTRFGTSFNSFYPLENMVTQIKEAIAQDAINAINGKATKIIDATTANQLVQQITNAYRQNHHLPLVGTGVVLPVSPARQNNKARQTKYRNNHERVMAWETADNNAILEAFKVKIQSLNDARIEYNAARALYNAALKQQPQNASQVASANALMMDKKAVFDDAKLA